MATAIQVGRRHILPGGYGADYSSYAAQQEANRQADIRARQQAAQDLADQKAEAEAKKLAAQAAASKATHDAAFNALRTRTNADWNLLKQRTDAKNNPKPVKVTTKEGDVTTTREVSPEAFAAEEKAKNLAKLTEKRDALKDAINFPFRNVPGKLKAVQDQINALNVPADLVTAQAGAPAAAPVVAAPTPRGFIGSPGANTFLAEPAPLGMDRAQTNAYAIKLNNERNPPPRDLLRGGSFPAGYQPEHGSFQVDPNPPASGGVVLDPPLAPYAEPVIPKTHIAHLLANPDTAADFDAKHGEGAAAKYLDPVAEE